jgi:hypothetical protein
LFAVFVVLNVVRCVVIVVLCVVFRGVTFCGRERAIFFSCLGAPCAGGGHFVTGIPLRLALPLVAMKIFPPTNGRPRAKPVYTSRSDRSARSRP